MSKKELLDILLSNSKLLLNLKNTLRHYPDIYNDFLTWVFPKEFSFSQKLYHYLYDDQELKLGHCKMCNNRCLFKSFTSGYCEYCSPKCRRKDINPMKSNESKIKLSETKKRQYSNKEWHDSVVNKNKVTCENRYGGIGFASPELKEKSLSTNFLTNGNRFYRNPEQIRKTNQLKFGVDYPFQSKEIQDKVTKTYIDKFGSKRNSNTFKKYYELIGIKNISQTHEWAVKVHKKVKYKNISFDSNWEVIVYKFCEEHNLNFEYQPDVLFEYEFDGIKHYYHPDFLIEGKLFEVKGEHFFDGDKMIIPFNRNKYTDDIAEAKHQCMIKNNVTIIRKNIIDNIESLLSLL